MLKKEIKSIMVGVNIYIKSVRCQAIYKTIFPRVYIV